MKFKILIGMIAALFFIGLTQNFGQEITNGKNYRFEQKNPKSKTSDNLLTVKNGQILPNRRVILAPGEADFLRAGTWKLRSAGNGFFYLLHENAELAMTLVGKPAASNSLALRPFKQNHRQQFKINKVSDDHYEIVNRKTPNHKVGVYSDGSVQNFKSKNSDKYTWTLREIKDEPVTNLGAGDLDLGNNWNTPNNDGLNDPKFDGSDKFQSFDKYLLDTDVILEGYNPPGKFHRERGTIPLYGHTDVLSNFRNDVMATRLANTHDENIIWKIIPDRKGYFKILHIAENKYLNVPHHRTINLGNDNRYALFFLQKIEDRYYIIPKDYPSKCIYFNIRETYDANGKRTHVKQLELKRKYKTYSWRIYKPIHETLREYKLKINTIEVLNANDGDPFIELYGKIDGVLETTNRTQRLLYKIPGYELIIKEGNKKEIKNHAPFTVYATENDLKNRVKKIGINFEQLRERDSFTDDSFGPTEVPWFFGEGIKTTILRSGGMTIKVHWGLVPWVSQYN